MIVCRPAILAEDMDACLAIRHAVFIDEQNVPEALERDGRDDECLHYLGFDGERAVATARVMPVEGACKFQRVAVLRDVRGQGVGTRLMRFMMDALSDTARAEGRLFKLSSQESAIPFYERLGFVVVSDVYMDAGIRHRDMEASP